jgi:hypothetical protein
MIATKGPPTQYRQLDMSKSRVLVKVVKPETACREANYSKDTINTRVESSSRGNMHIMDVNSSSTVRIGLKESQQHSAGTPATGAGTHN